MKKQIIIHLINGVPRHEYAQFKSPVNWQISSGEHWAVIGANGSGKTILTDMLLNRYAFKEGEVQCFSEKGEYVSPMSVAKSVAFRDIYSMVDADNSYYQQRWNKGSKQDTPMVSDLVNKADRQYLEELLHWFGVSELMDKEVDMLSSGELRKFLIIRSLLSNPRLLVLDNPFIGLDAPSRTMLSDLFVSLSQHRNLQIVLVLSNPNDIPDFITHVQPVCNKEQLPAMSREAFFDNKELIDRLFVKNASVENLAELKEVSNDNSSIFDYAAILKNISVRYGEQTILKDLNWEIKHGEKWALLGANGSGKSTLLSLIAGDNPQAYANDITLFDRKRGTGESIWDIKKRIGYISPEMHLYYMKNVRCLDVVGSGFFDTVGLYRKCSAEQERLALQWMQVFGVSHLSEVSFLHVSSGEQRLVLLARLFVKNPDLLILDEPLHGLDVANKQFVKKLIEEYCGEDKSLIYVTHYEEEIPSIIEKRLLLQKIYE
ncbi:ATP-binding cassette domain-containing protein [Dysgonomonas sp. Marseille-P4361]|uniref:ATP-binding cassette domain-containing protein n=1 Tax=Dysgonomonas sp. Marseille-P4361 TaxID=2161820 RepID=UPI000D55B51B|nr:ATP-binding cassette domain-containing protein [Dysgonomonas sp. Marseille-P4361]